MNIANNIADEASDFDETHCSVCAEGIATAIRSRSTSPSPPSAEPPDDAWIIVYEDPEMPDEKFSGFGATEAAGKRFDAIRVSWNCHLFRRVVDASGAPPPCFG